MKIKILNCNVTKDYHPSSEAWRLSRPNNSPIELGKILSLDLPVNEMPTANLFIESTIIEREIILSARNHSAWAQTSRVQDVLEFEYPEELNDYGHYFELKRTEMKMGKELGERQDHYRKYLPLFSTAKYTVNLSMRDIAHFCKFFEFQASKISHLEKVFNSAYKAFLEILKNNFYFTEENLKSYKYNNFLNEINNPNSGIVGDTLVINTSVSIGLRAQLARHRALHLQDNLLQLISDNDIIKSDNTLMINVQVSGLVSDWKNIVRKRSCFIAQYDLWKDLLDKAENFMKLGNDGLPCHNGICPFHGDALARYTNEDPNAPCPKHSLLNNISITESQVIEVQEQLKSDKRPQFWENILNEVEKK